MATYEPIGAAELAYSRDNSNREENSGNSSSNVVQVKKNNISDYTEEEIVKLIENDRKIRAENNTAVHKGLVAATEWRKKHRGNGDLSYIVRKGKSSKSAE
ncbi:MAG: hypothetical protein ACR2N3_02600 [Pyrinomonadaceae bacterium]